MSPHEAAEAARDFLSRRALDVSADDAGIHVTLASDVAVDDGVAEATAALLDEMCEASPGMADVKIIVSFEVHE